MRIRGVARARGFGVQKPHFAAPATNGVRGAGASGGAGAGPNVCGVAADRCCRVTPFGPPGPLPLCTSRRCPMCLSPGLTVSEARGAWRCAPSAALPPPDLRPASLCPTTPSAGSC